MYTEMKDKFRSKIPPFPNLAHLPWTGNYAVLCSYFVSLWLSCTQEIYYYISQNGNSGNDKRR